MKNYIYYLFLVSILSLAGCLEDNIIIPDVQDPENSALMLTYLEAQGDFVNSFGYPAMVTAEQVHDDVDFTSAMIIDIRSEELFSLGHIPGAVNTVPQNLIEIIEGASVGIPVVIVSETGQRAGYFACLMRLYGFGNVYSLACGMTTWHEDFSYAYMDYLWEDNFYTKVATNLTYESDDYYGFPGVEVTDTEADTPQAILRARIRDLLEYDIQLGEGIYENEISISKRAYYDYFNSLNNLFPDLYTIAYGYENIYYVGKTGELQNPGHFAGSYWYELTNGAKSDFRSTEKLQQIPSDMPIVVYSYSGQLSAYIVAYLQVLGYNAKSLVYGGHVLYYGRSSNYYYSFRTSRIKNYDYETGN